MATSQRSKRIIIAVLGVALAFFLGGDIKVAVQNAANAILIPVAE